MAVLLLLLTGYCLEGRRGSQNCAGLASRAVRHPPPCLHSTQTHKGIVTICLQICMDTKMLVASEYFLMHKNHRNIDCLNILFSRGFILSRSFILS